MPSEFGSFWLEIVDHDQVEVGARRHLPGAEPAEREDRGLLAADAAVCGGEILLHLAVHRADEHVGKPRKNLAGLLGRHRARQDARADQEHVLLAEQADGVEHVFVALGLDQPAGEFGFELRFIGQRAEKTRLDQRIDQIRALRQNVGEARRDAKDQGDETDELRVLPQQRQEQTAGAQPGQEAIEGREGGVRIFGARELLDDQWHELDDIVAHLLAAQRPVFPCPPAAHRGGNVLRLPETQHRQPIERVAFDVGADEREVLLLGEEGRRALE